MPDLYVVLLPEESLTKQPLFKGGAEEDDELDRPHPHPECSPGFCFPLESPGPTPVTDDATIFFSKKNRASLPLAHILAHKYVRAPRQENHFVYPFAFVFIQNAIYSFALLNNIYVASKRRLVGNLVAHHLSVLYVEFEGWMVGIEEHRLELCKNRVYEL